MTAAVHNFGRSLARSHAASDWHGWETIYRQAFPSFQVMVDHRQDGDHQRLGIDRSVVLANGKQIWIDEKVRESCEERTGEPWRDVALETVSNDRTGAPGWVVKPLLCDFIAYANMPLGQCCLLPVIQLQLAWQRHGRGWTEKYGERRAPNEGYMTRFVPVPVNVLFKAIGSCLRVSFEPDFDFCAEEARR